MVRVRLGLGLFSTLIITVENVGRDVDCVENVPQKNRRKVYFSSAVENVLEDVGCVKIVLVRL